MTDKYCPHFRTMKAVITSIESADGPISTSRIADDTGLSQRSVFRIVAYLEAHAKIKRINGPGKAANSYQVLSDPPLPPGVGAVKQILKETREQPISAADIGLQCDLSERQVYRVIELLEDMNKIRRFGGGPYNTYSYEVVA